MEHLNLDLLRTIVLIDKGKTFPGAADALHKTQSAVTQQMQHLEAQIGCAFFKKQGPHRILTSQGQQLALYSRKLLAINDEALRSIGKNQMEGQIRIGAPLDAADTILSSLVT